MAFFAVHDLIVLDHGHSFAKSGGLGTAVPRPAAKTYKTVSRHTAPVAVVSPHGAGLSTPSPVHEVVWCLLEACVPLPHGSGSVDRSWG